MTLNINLNRVRNAVGITTNYELIEEKIDLTSELEMVKPIRISVMVTNNGPILELKGYINTEIKARCNRCLEDVIIPINTVIEEELVYFADLRYLGNLSENEIEEKYIVFDNDIFDLTDIVRENIILSLPYKILCDERCRGLCFRCGQNLNIKECDCNTEEIDPRLAILAKLKRD